MAKVEIAYRRTPLLYITIHRECLVDMSTVCMQEDGLDFLNGGKPIGPKVVPFYILVYVFA